jgi:glycosyltransferase involved in cell wall biosynthesis
MQMHAGSGRATDNSNLQVLFVTRPTVFANPGGDTVQLDKTAEALRRMGVKVDIAGSSAPTFKGYDLVHFFNLRNPQDLLHHVRRAKRYGLPSVLSTIWGSYYEGDMYARTGLQGVVVRNFSEAKVEYLKVVARAIKNRNFTRGTLAYLVRGHWAAQKEIVDSVDLLLPNSPTELQRVRRDMTSVSKPGVYVPNAVDLDIFDETKTRVDPELARYSGCIISAARIELRKCQLELIRAVRGMPCELVLVGRPSPNSRSYYRACKAEAGSNVHFIDHVSQEALAQLYKVAKAHALISWMETPGLSSLEAAAMGCNLVITDRGDTRFYFGDFAHYVEPGDVDSIRRGIVRAMELDPDPRLKKRIAENFTWAHTAEKTIEGYRLALSGEKNDLPQT